MHLLDFYESDCHCGHVYHCPCTSAFNLLKLCALSPRRREGEGRGKEQGSISSLLLFPLPALTVFTSICYDSHIVSLCQADCNAFQFPYCVLNQQIYSVYIAFHVIFEVEPKMTEQSHNDQH